MKKNLFLCLSLSLLLLSACGGDGEAAPQAEAPSPTAEPMVSPTAEPLPSPTAEPLPSPTAEPLPSPTAEPEPLTGPECWIYTDRSGEALRAYSLHFMEGGELQMPVQDEALNLLALYGGSWSRPDREHLQLELAADPMSGSPWAEHSPLSIFFYYSFDDKGDLYLFPMPEDTPLIPGQEGEILCFRSVEKYREESRNESSAEDTEKYARGVLAWYESFSVSPYPGTAEVDRIDEEGVHVHLYEDMDTHTATLGWYCIDTETLMGYDEMMGTAIDFAPWISP